MSRGQAVTNSHPIISIRDLELTLNSGDRLKVPSLHLEVGEILRIFGPIGSGKSTLLNVLTGISPESIVGKWTGEIHITGRPLSAYHIYNHPACMMWQDQRLFANMSPRKNIEFPLRMAGYSNQQRRTYVAALMDRLNATRLLEKESVDQLSGGERQTVALARTLARLECGNGSKLLLLDEPFRNLEIDVATRFLGVIRDSIVNVGGCALLVSHESTDISTDHEPIAIISNGILRQYESLSHVLSMGEMPSLSEALGLNNRISENLVVPVAKVVLGKTKECTTQITVISVSRHVEGHVVTGISNGYRCVVRTDEVERVRPGETTAVSWEKSDERQREERT